MNEHIHNDKLNDQDRFSSFLEEKNDRIDCAAYDLICWLATSKSNFDASEDDPPISCDMSMIGELVDYAEMMISRREKPVCRPFYEGDGEITCYLGEDCKRKDCVFRKEVQ